ncbi:MAG: 50S ribosomal protein L25 [Candidatus Shapirobacteria bacterium]
MTHQRPQLEVTKREITGRKVKHLRKDGITPAGIYGNGYDSISISVNTRQLDKIYDEVGESGLVDLMLEGTKIPVLFRNAQYHPVGGNLIHVDCFKVNLKEKIVATVPVELIGEAPIVKAGNILVPVASEIEVEALPADLPEKIEIDISNMETLEAMITAGDIKLDEKVELKSSADLVIVKVEEPKEEEEPVAEEVAPGDVPATEQKAPGEGEEGEEKKEEEK